MLIDCTLVSIRDNKRAKGQQIESVLFCDVYVQQHCSYEMKNRFKIYLPNFKLRI